MRYSVAFLTVIFATCGWAFSAAAQVTSNRDSAEYYFRRGDFFEYKAEDDWAMNTSDAVSPGHPSEAEARKQAIACYTKSIAFDSSYYWSYRNRGRCYQISKEYASALADYNRAVMCESDEALGANDFSVRFDCINMCFRLALWREAEAHCSVILANPSSCADTTCTYCYTTDREWPVPRPDCSHIWLRRADARAKLEQYALARQDYLIYRRQLFKKIVIEEKALADNQVPPALYWRRAIPTSKKERAKTPTALTKLSPRQPLPQHLRAEVLARHQKMLVRQRARIAELRTESAAVTIKVAELDRLLH